MHTVDATLAHVLADSRNQAASIHTDLVRQVEHVERLQREPSPGLRRPIAAWRRSREISRAVRHMRRLERAAVQYRALELHLGRAIGLLAGTA